MVSAAVGGYGLDQIVLRTEELLPVVRPKVIVIGVEQALALTAYSSFGWSKPYFPMEDARLVLHNVPVPPPGTNRRHATWFCRFAGRISYSVYLFHLLVAVKLSGVLGALPMGEQLVIYVCSCVLLSTVFFHYFERPILALRPVYASGKVDDSQEELVPAQ